MKILFVHDHVLKKEKNNYYSSGGLSQEIMGRYMKGNDQVYVYTRVQEGNNENIKNLKKVNDINIICKPSTIYKTPRDLIMKKRIIKKEIDEIIREMDCFIIRLPSVLGGMVLDKIIKMNKPYIIEMVACPWDAFWNYGNIQGKIFAPYMYLKTKKQIKKGKNVLYVSDSFLQKRYPTRGNNIGCSDVCIKQIDNEIIEKRMSKIEKMNEKNEIIITTIGATDVKYKGQKYVIKAISKMKKEGYNLKYQIIGRGDTSYLRNIAKQKHVERQVDFVGNITHDKIFDYLDDTDIYIQPSNQEGLCRALIEAMSRGCLCIASNAGGNVELIDNEYIFKKKNIKDLKAKTTKMIKTNQKKDIAKVNYEKTKKYCMNELDNKRAKFYNKCLIKQEEKTYD